MSALVAIVLIVYSQYTHYMCDDRFNICDLFRDMKLNQDHVNR